MRRKFNVLQMVTVNDIKIYNAYLINSSINYIDGVRYLKTKYQDNYKRFKQMFIIPYSEILEIEEIHNRKEIIDFYNTYWGITTPFSYKEAFALTNIAFQIEVFLVINVGEMVENLGHKRISTEGIELVNNTFNITTGEFEQIKLSQVYELHEIDGSKLGINNFIYAVKAWCTSTNSEHWLWVEKKMQPLVAIASTCRVYEKMIPHIKHIIRQGDVFIFEMKDDDFSLDEKDTVVPLTKEIYFKLLKSQS